MNMLIVFFSYMFTSNLNRDIFKH